jgi:hypothetical protein
MDMGSDRVRPPEVHLGLFFFAGMSGKQDEGEGIGNGAAGLGRQI